MNKTNALASVTVLLQICFWTMSVSQMIAEYAAFRHHWQWHGLFAFAAALLTGFMPAVGTTIAIIGATKVWNWSMRDACFFYIGPLVLFIILVSTIAVMKKRFAFDMYFERDR